MTNMKVIYQVKGDPRICWTTVLTDSEKQAVEMAAMCGCEEFECSEENYPPSQEWWDKAEVLGCIPIEG